MTAYEMVAAGPQALATGAEVTEQLAGSGLDARNEAKGLRSPIVLFVMDVAEGVRVVSHNALAMLGFVAVVGALFLMGRADVRYNLESQTLNWLMERANLRAIASGEAEEDGDLLAVAEPEAIQRATASFRPLGGSGSLRLARTRPISRNSLTSSAPMPKATRRGVPNRLARTGIL